MATSEKTRREIELHKTVGKQYRVRYRFPFAAEFQAERNGLIMDLLEGTGDELVVDLGCGTGVMMDALKSRFRRVVGLDASDEMIGAVDRSPLLEDAPPVELVIGDMEKIPFREASVDRVVCRSILHHVEDDQGALTEVFRILKPGGRLVVAEPMNDNPLFRLARWKVRRGKGYGTIHTIDKAYLAGEIRGMLERAGFVLRREVRYGFIAYPLCDNPDLVPVLLRMPFREGIARALRALDRGLARLPVIRRLSWYAIFSAERPREAPPSRPSSPGGEA